MTEINVGPALEHLERLSRDHQSKLTLTHYVARAIALTFRDNPEINTVIRWGKLYQRAQVDIFVHVAMDSKGEDLSGVVIRNLDKKTLAQVAEELNHRVKELKTKGDPSFNKLKTTIKFVPSFILRHVLDLVGFILYSLNLWSPALNVEKDPFGSAMVTNIGSLGADFAFTPIPYYSRVPFILSIGAVKDAPGVNKETKTLEVQKIVKFGVTFDHRVIDGVHAARMSKDFKIYMENPNLL
jgi:pyruvate dehydrogenase E2 component (dihydrolipoamide acetyltransferase)